MIPHDWQEADIERIMNHPGKSAVIASVVGTGKTLIGTEIIKRANKSVNLIIAPLNTYDSWARTVEEQMGVLIQHVSTKSSQSEASFINLHEGEPGTYFIGWELARRYAGIVRKVEVLIGDEIHRASNRKTATFATWNLAALSVQENGGYAIGMSATPWGNKPEGAWAVTRPLWPDFVPRSFWKWASKYMQIEANPYTANTHSKVVTGETNAGAVVADLPLYIRHERDFKCCEFHPNGVQEDLPRRVFHDIFVDLTPTQTKIYKQLEKDMFAWIEEHDWPLDTDGYPMVQALRLHQVTLAVPTPEMVMRLKTNEDGIKELVEGTTVTFDLDAKSSKIDAVLSIIEDQANDEPILILTHSSAIIPALVHRINKKIKVEVAFAWMGSTPTDTRQEIKDSFMSRSKARIIVANVAAIGEGVDGLQEVCHTEIWLSTTDNGVFNTQAKGRLLRIGQKVDVQSYRVMSRNTVEEAQMQRLFTREEAMHESLHASN